MYKNTKLAIIPIFPFVKNPRGYIVCNFAWELHCVKGMKCSTDKKPVLQCMEPQSSALGRYKRLQFTAYCPVHCEPFIAIFVFHTPHGSILGKNQNLNTIADCFQNRQLMICCIVLGQRFQGGPQSMII